MIKQAFLVGAGFLLSWSIAAPVYGFGSATHAYIAREVGSTEGPASLQEIYGALLPDVFNTMFVDPYGASLATQTHYEFMKFVAKAESENDKAVARGFASHNEAWGADRMAHVSSIGDPNTGYVIRKSDELAAALKPQVKLFLLLAGVADPDAVIDEILPGVAHTAIETAVDLLICQNEDPQIGPRLVLAAQVRGWSSPILLCKAYAGDVAAAAGITEAVAAPLIVAAENEFRLQMELYGAALSQGNAADALAEQGVGLAKSFVAATQGLVIDIPVDLMKQILTSAIEVVKDDYAAQVAATITRVRQELKSHGVVE
ncbi:MAG: hypothetical protein M1376_22930 [Planctomycetes bacterium]|nr:hypothetical protein [Planctomycetota bacterium]